MTDEPRRYLNISFHDLAPHSREHCELFLSDMRSLGVEKTSHLLVPNWYGRTPLNEHPAFCQWVQSLQDYGHEICLHGYTHSNQSIQGGLSAQLKARFYTAKEDEFSQLSYSEAEKLLQQGLALFEECGIKHKGFIAPAWLLSSEARRAVTDNHFDFTTRLTRIDDLPRTTSHFAPAVVWSCRSLWRRAVSRLWVQLCFRLHRNANILRIVVHPKDMDYPGIRSTIMRFTERALKIALKRATHST